MPYEVAFIGLRNAQGRFIAAKDGLPVHAEAKAEELALALEAVYIEHAPARTYPFPSWKEDPGEFRDSIHGENMGYVAGATGNMRGFAVAVITEQPDIAAYIRNGRPALGGSRYYFLGMDGSGVAPTSVAPVAPNTWEREAMVDAEVITAAAAQELGNSIVRDVSEVSL